MNVVLLISLNHEKKVVKSTKNNLQEIFASNYYDTVLELEHLIEMDITETAIPQPNREQIVARVALVQSSGMQLRRLVNKNEIVKIELIVKVFKDLEYSMRNNEFSNVCYFSDDKSKSANNLEGYLFLLDNIANSSGTGLELYNKVLENWDYTLHDLEKNCRFEYGI